MAIVLVIVGLLVTAFVAPLTTQIELRNNAETKAVLDEAREALVGFAISNHFLPCPDTAAIPAGVEGARDAVNECLVTEGALPWQALGVRGVDAWGHYIRYRVTKEFTNSATFFEISDNGNITVNSDTGTLTTKAVAVLVSHGTNGFGGISTTQATPANLMPAPAGADEQENADADAVFISHTPTPQGSVNEFDDSATWLSPAILVNRMVTAGQLP